MISPVEPETSKPSVLCARLPAFPAATLTVAPEMVSGAGFAIEKACMGGFYKRAKGNRLAGETEVKRRLGRC